jgi:uncharacterized paraquat-inducible protein A
MALACPACGHAVSRWTNSAEFKCPQCQTPLRLQWVLPLIAATVVAPLLALPISATACGGEPGTCFWTLNTVLSIVLGIVAYGLVVSIERNG